MPVNFILYGKQDCHLCHEMKIQLERLIAMQDCTYQVIKIDGDPGMERLYGARVPVLTAGDTELCNFKLDESAVMAYLSKSSPN